MTILRKPTRKFLFNGAYKISSVAESDCVEIFRKEKNGRYKRVGSVFDAADNYRAAVKRAARMYARDLAASKISVPEKSKANTSPKDNKSTDKVDLIRRALTDYAQAHVTLNTNIDGLVKKYIIKIERKKTPGSTKTTKTYTGFVKILGKNPSYGFLHPIVSKPSLSKVLDFIQADSCTLRKVSMLVIYGVGGCGSAQMQRNEIDFYVSSSDPIDLIKESFNSSMEDFFKVSGLVGKPT